MQALQDSQAKRPSLEPAFVTIPAGCDFLGLKQASVYRLIGRGEIEARKSGKRTLLTVASLKRYADLPAAKIKPPVARKRA